MTRWSVLALACALGVSGILEMINRAYRQVLEPDRVDRLRAVVKK